MEELYCDDNDLTGLLDLSDFTLLRSLYCNDNRFTGLDVTNCTNLMEIYCENNSLAELDLTDLNLWSFNGADQNVFLSFIEKNEEGDYIFPISLNRPTFGGAAISYSAGILKSTDNTIGSSYFQVETNVEYMQLTGTMNFDYFDKQTFTITASVSNAGGTITPNGPVTVNYGEDQTYTITPDEDYEIADVLVDGASVGKEETYTFEKVAANHTIGATFQVKTAIDEVETVTLKIYPNPTGGE